MNAYLNWIWNWLPLDGMGNEMKRKARRHVCLAFDFVKLRGRIYYCSTCGKRWRLVKP